MVRFGGSHVHHKVRQPFPQGDVQVVVYGNVCQPDGLNAFKHSLRDQVDPADQAHIGVAGQGRRPGPPHASSADE